MFSGEVRINDDNILPLASAMAERQINEKNLAEAQIADLTGQPYDVPSLELQRAMATASTVVMLKRLADPDLVIDPAETLATVMEDEYLDIAIRAKGIEPDDEARAMVRALALTSMEAFVEHAYDDDDGAERLKRTLSATVAVADENGVSLDAVHLEDAYYDQMMRRAWTPAEFTKDNLEVLAKMGRELVQQLFSGVVGVMVRSEMQGEVSEEEILAEIEECLADAEGSEELAAAHQDMALIKGATRSVIRMQLQRFWGEHALSLLPRDLMLQLVD